MGGGLRPPLSADNADIEDRRQLLEGLAHRHQRLGQQFMAHPPAQADANAAAQPLADFGAAVDTAVKSGALTLPYMVKGGGAQGALANMTELANGMAAVFAAAQAPAK